MRELTKKLGLRYAPRVFKNEKFAVSYAEKATKFAWIILGDNSEYWVVCPADFEKLIKAGYEAK